MTLLPQVSELYRPEAVLCQSRLGTARAKNAGTALQDIGHLLHQWGFLNAAPPQPIPANSAVLEEVGAPWPGHAELQHSPAHPSKPYRLQTTPQEPDQPWATAHNSQRSQADQPATQPGLQHTTLVKYRLHNVQWLCYLSVSISPESCLLPSAGRGSKKSRIQNILWIAKPLERSIKEFTAFYKPSEKAS